MRLFRTIFTTGAFLLNAVATAWVVLVFLGSAQVLGNVVLIPEDEAVLMIALAAIAFIMNLALGIQVWRWSRAVDRRERGAAS